MLVTEVILHIMRSRKRVRQKICTLSVNLSEIIEGMIALKQRLGTESQLPFGYCGLSMYPAEDPVVTPSGHIYSRESILEYLLTKSKEIKEQCKAYEEQQVRMSLSL